MSEFAIETIKNSLFIGLSRAIIKFCLERALWNSSTLLAL